MDIFWETLTVREQGSARKFLNLHWRGDRAVEGARLEIVCTPKEYRGFESPPLRHLS
jgi:hypothetical protein